MIFLNKDINNTSIETINLIEIEKAFLNSNIIIQKKKKTIILNYIQSFINDSESIINLKNCLNMCNDNIEQIRKCIGSIDNIISSIKSQDSNIENIVRDFNLQYAELNKNLITNNLDIEKCLADITKKTFYENYNIESQPKSGLKPEFEPEAKLETVIECKPEPESKLEVEPEVNQKTKSEIEPIIEPETEPESNQKTELEFEQDFTHILFPKDVKEIEFKINPIYSHEENTLVVSEKTGTVTLPYDMSNVNEILKNSHGKFKSIDEVIIKKYTLPIKSFKNPITARFKEAFYLMRYKEHGSIFDGLELGFELMFKYNLHPAVISACKNLDELDIYLDYLKSGKTDKFKCFNIIFDLPPMVSKQGKHSF